MFSTFSIIIQVTLCDRQKIIFKYSDSYFRLIRSTEVSYFCFDIFDEVWVACTTGHYREEALNSKSSNGPWFKPWCWSILWSYFLTVTFQITFPFLWKTVSSPKLCLFRMLFSFFYPGSVLLSILRSVIFFLLSFVIYWSLVYWSVVPSKDPFTAS